MLCALNEKQKCKRCGHCSEAISHMERDLQRELSIIWIEGGGSLMGHCAEAGQCLLGIQRGLPGAVTDELGLEQ